MLVIIRDSIPLGYPRKKTIPKITSNKAEGNCRRKLPEKHNTANNEKLMKLPQPPV